MTKKLIVLAVAGAFAAGGTAFAGGKDGHAMKTGEKMHEGMKSAQAEKAKPRQVSGHITHMKEVEVRGTDTKNQVVMIKTSKGDRRLVIDLGPTSALEELNLKQGGEIAVEGSLVQIRDRSFIVASRLRHGDKTVDISRQEQQRQAQTQREGMEEQAS